ncbi:MAG: hypothetical protein U1F76_18105 [Candidatus Competibacteraceae bacterium]
MEKRIDLNASDLSQQHFWNTTDDLKRVAANYLAPERASLAVVSDPETLSRQDGLDMIAL